MSHVEVHLLGVRQRERLGHRTQLEALAPFPERPPQELWEFRRGRWAGRRPLAGAALLAEDLELAPGLEEMGGEVPPRAGGGRDPVFTNPSLCGIPQQRSFALVINHDLGTSNFYAATSPPIPWAFQIVNATLLPNTTPGDFPTWNLYVTDADQTGPITSPLGTPLIENVTTRNVGVGPNFTTATRNIGMPYQQGSVPAYIQGASAGLVGTTIGEAGKRLALVAAAGDFSQAVSLALLVTVRELIAQCAPAPRIVSAGTAAAPRAAATPRAAAAPRTTAAAAPAPAERSFGFSSSGAYPIMGGTSAEGITVQRWALPSQPGRTFATLAEANVAWQAEQATALPAAQRPAALTAARRAAGALQFGAGEIASPTTFVLNPTATAGVARGTIGTAGRLDAPPYNPRVFGFR